MRQSSLSFSSSLSTSSSLKPHENIIDLSYESNEDSPVIFKHPHLERQKRVMNSIPSSSSSSYSSSENEWMQSSLSSSYSSSKRVPSGASQRARSSDNVWMHSSVTSSSSSSSPHKSSWGASWAGSRELSSDGVVRDTFNHSTTSTQRVYDNPWASRKHNVDEYMEQPVKTKKKRTSNDNLSNLRDRVLKRQNKLHISDMRTTVGKELSSWHTNSNYHQEMGIDSGDVDDMGRAMYLATNDYYDHHRGGQYDPSIDRLSYNYGNYEDDDDEEYNAINEKRLQEEKKRKDQLKKKLQINVMDVMEKFVPHKPSSSSTSSSSERAAAVSKYMTCLQDVERNDMNTVELLLQWKGENMNRISSIPLYQAILRQDLSKGDHNHAYVHSAHINDNDQCKLRFNNEEAYLNYFQPLLLQETCASVYRSIVMPETNEQTSISLVTCLSIRTFTHKDGNNNSEDIKDCKSGNSDKTTTTTTTATDPSGLVEAHLRLPVDKKRRKHEILKDDLVVLVKPSGTNESRFVSPSPHDMLIRHPNDCDLCIVLSKPTLNHPYNKKG